MAEPEAPQVAMGDLEYFATQTRILAVGALTAGIDLESFIARSQRAVDVGCALNPALAQSGNGMPKLRRVIRLAEKLQEVRQIMDEMHEGMAQEVNRG